jgi:hypothetical protein
MAEQLEISANRLE